MFKASLCTIGACALLAAGSSSAAVVYGTGVTGTAAEVNSTSVGTYSGDVSNSDILTGLTPTFTASDWLSGRNPDRLNDGLHGADGSVDNVAQAASPPASAVFDLGTGDNGLGYDLTSIVSIAAWAGVEFGEQVWTLEVKGIEPTDTYSTLLSVDYQPGDGANATKVTITDLAGELASGVQFIRVTSQPNPGGLNSRFVWRELDVVASATVPEPGSLALLGLGGLLIGKRRRRA